MKKPRKHFKKNLKKDEITTISTLRNNKTSYLNLLTKDELL